MGIKKIILILSILLMFSCEEDKTIGLKNCYETTYHVYYGYKYRRTYVTYTENETFACSFGGTNYLFEKDKEEEIFSSTAPIEIVEQIKYDKDGNYTEVKQNDTRKKN